MSFNFHLHVKLQIEKQKAAPKSDRKKNMVESDIIDTRANTRSLTLLAWYKLFE